MKEFIEKFKETIEIEEKEIKPEDNYQEYEEWDSLAYLGLLAMVKDEYNVDLTRDDINKSISISDLYETIKGKM
jgi:acyl carrier protein